MLLEVRAIRLCRSLAFSRLATTAGKEGTTTALNRSGAAGDGGDDRKFGGFCDRGVFFFGEVADVFVIDIHIDERPQLAFGREQVPAHGGELLHQVFQALGDGGATGGNSFLFVGVSAQRCGDVNLHSF